jgi:hypothetical protein
MSVSARTMLVTPRCSVRTVNPATVVANQRNVGNRENAGRNICSAFHHKTHNGIGTPICSCRVIVHSIAYISYTVNMATTRIEQIHNRIEQIKTELVAIDEMRPGSVSKQFKEPDLERGAYYQLNYSQGGRSRTEYVAPAFLRDVRRQISNYKRFKELTAEWIELSIEQSRLKIKSASKP